MRRELASLTSSWACLDWLLGTLHPTWADPAAERENRDQPYEFTMVFGRLLGRLCGYMTLEEAQRLFLTRILELPGDRCWDVLEPLVDTFVRVHVMDADRMPSNAPALLGECLSRLLRDAAFRPGGYRSGQLHGFHMHQLVDALFLVNADEAPRSARFANGDWMAIEVFIPVVDRFIRTAGWSSAVMGRFLTLCERARAALSRADLRRSGARGASKVQQASRKLPRVGSGQAFRPGWRALSSNSRTGRPQWKSAWHGSFSGSWTTWSTSETAALRLSRTARHSGRWPSSELIKIS